MRRNGQLARGKRDRHVSSQKSESQEVTNTRLAIGMRRDDSKDNLVTLQRAAGATPVGVRADFPGVSRSSDVTH
ncbi:unnamed protein product [Pieris brassicae]|uniref:Uncharacterized protein n=1 Tax=Pieris brassicae TaxID=7116 RepID=A0A9P0SA05_PIEBR|nr:unnamed protein product [Pieris brassicae]